MELMRQRASAKGTEKKEDINITLGTVVSAGSETLLWKTERKGKKKKKPGSPNFSSKTPTGLQKQVQRGKLIVNELENLGKPTPYCYKKGGAKGRESHAVPPA